MRKIYLLLLAVFFQLMAIAQPVTIGTGTSTSNSPWHTFYGFSYVQTIYLASEINSTGSISSVQFFYAGTALDASDSIVMYIGTTAKTSFATTSDWVPNTSLTEVFNGVISAPTLPGLVTVTLSTPFPYTGSGNLLIAVDENKPGDNGSTRFQGTTIAGSNRVLANYSDATNPDPAAPPTGVRSSIVGNIIITGLAQAACQPATSLAVNTITQTSVIATWSAPGGGNPVNTYNYEVRTSGAPGSGSAGLATSGNSATTSANITGLTSATQYTFYVRPDCGSGNQGSWISVIFTTQCGIVTDFSQNFDAVVTPALPPCWTKVGTQGLANTQTTNPNSGPNTLYIYGSSATAQAVVAMPAVSNAGAGNRQLKFSMRANFTVGGIIQVGYLTNPADSSSFVLLQVDTATGLVYKSFTLVPTGVTGSSVTFAFRHFGTPAYSVLIDDVSWEALANCVEPSTLVVSNVTGTTAQLGWTAPTLGSPASYEVYRNTLSTAPSGTTTPTATGITGTTYNFTALSPATKYFVWVRSNCGTGGVSTWSAVDSFTTQCGPANVPYTQDFESAMIPGLPGCTSVENVGLGNNWITVANPGSGFTSKTLRYVYNTANAADAWFYTQGLTLTAGTSYRLTFRYGNNSTTYIESMNVSYGNAASATSMTNLIVDYPTITGAAATTSTNDFTPSATGVYYIGFHAYSVANQFNIHVDDISVTLTPLCDVPTALNVTNITTTGATLNWSAPATAPLSYEVYYSTSSVVPTGTTIPSSTGITNTTYDLTALSPATKYFYWIRSNCGAGGVSVWSVVDSLTTLPSCDVPTALVHINVTGTSAQLDWTAPASGSPSSYDIYSNTANTAPTGITTPTATGITSASYNLTGLIAATKYFVWVRSNCGTGGVSTWSVADSFTTQCAPTNVPYTQDFESAAVPGLPLCTSNENIGTGNNWVTASNPGSGFTSETLKYGYNSANPADAWFYTQGLNLTAGTSYRLSFKYGNNSTTYVESMNVSYGMSPTSTSMNDLIVDYPSITGGVPAASATDFTPSTTGIYYVGFHVSSLANQYNLYVDDIAVSVTPTCDVPNLLAVTNVTGTGATINWTAPATPPSGYDIYYNSLSTAPTGSTTPTVSGVTNTSYDITTLSPSTKYYYWIRSNCGAGGVSVWTGVDSFFTQCGATNIPYTQDFETAIVPGFPVCTSIENVGTGNNWATIAAPGSGFTSKTLRYNYNSTNAADAWFYTQGINLTAGTSYRLSFKYGNNSTTYIESMNVSYGAAANATSMTDLIVDYPSITGGIASASITDFTPATTGVYYLGFHAYSIADQFYLYVDNISVTVSPTCDVPSLLPVTNITTTGGTLNWNAPTVGSPASYEVYYNTANTAPTGSTTPTNIGITNTTYDLTTLASSTKYYYWLRSNCGAGGVSVWTGVDSFTTLATCDTPTAVVVSNITTTTAQIDWTTPSTGSPASYDVYFSNVNTAPTGTTTPTGTGITGTTFTFTTLTAATTYYAWVRSNCGLGGTSAWTYRVIFTTQCVAVTDFYQSFDAVTTPALPVCWSKVSTTGLANTQTTNPLSAPNTMYIYGTSATAQSVVAMTPVSNADLNTHRLRFNARGNFTAGAVIQVGYLTDPTDATTFTSLQDVTVSTLTYQSFTVIPGSINPGSNTVFAFRHIGTPAYSVLIDDVYWEVVPGCIEPTALVASNISLNGAQIDWTAPSAGSPASYEVYYNTSNTAPTATTVPSITGVTGTTANLAGLASSSTYYVWVRSNCGTGGLSVWTSYVTFTTLCGVITAPTAAPETFATAVPPSTCWSRAQGILAAPTVFTNTTTSGWVLDDFTNRTTPVNKSSKLNIYGTTRKEWLITPMYDLGAGGNYKLEFDLGFTTWNDTTANVLGADDKFAVIISTDNGVTWSDANTLQSWNSTTPISSTGEHVVIDLATYSGTVMFGFYGESTITGNGDNDVFVDNMEVLLRPVPVTLSSFKGEKQGSKNLLTWTTASEQNNKGYELQRSANGENFSTIAFVSSRAVNGNSNAALSYYYSDEKPFSGNNYYRLKQLDFDGKSTLSNVVLIKGAGTNSIVLSSVYPNPARNQLNVILSAPTNDRVSLVVTDVAGKVVMQQATQLQSGDNYLKLNVSGLLSGTYMIKAVCNNGCQTAVSKFVKQ